MSNRLQSQTCERIRMAEPMPIVASVNGHAQAVVVIVSKEPLFAILDDGQRPSTVEPSRGLDQYASRWKQAA